MSLERISHLRKHGPLLVLSALLLCAGLSHAQRSEDTDEATESRFSPEASATFNRRCTACHTYVFAANLMVNWLIPFLVLISRRAKSNTRTLRLICILLLGGHWLDLYLLIMPAMWPAPRLGLFEIATAAGFAALVYLVFIHALGRAPLVPVNDPVLAYERLHPIHRDEARVQP